MKRKTKTTSLVILGSVVGMALISNGIKENPSVNEPSRVEKKVEIPDGNTARYIVKKEDLNLIQLRSAKKAIERPISGRVIAKNTTQLFSEVQGKVLPHGFKLEEGITFKSEELLVQLDSKEFELQLEAEKSKFLNILTGIIPDLKSDYTDNYINWLKYIQEYKIGHNLAPLPSTITEGERYFVTSNQVYSTYYSIKALEERLTKYKIMAPYSGTVISAGADMGSLVFPGQILGTIINNKSYELEAAVAFDTASKLKVGDQVAFRSNELDGKWIGTLLRINDVIDTKTQNVPVYFGINGADLKTGMYLEGSFTVDSIEEVFSIPTSLLTRDDKVLILEGNTIKGKSIEPIEFMPDSILIRGLSNSDLLIANQFNVPVEGLKLSVN